MSWVRIDDKAWSHPKLAGLSGNAVRLWLFALCWCNQQESDGRVPATMLRIFGASPKVAAELVAAGLWETAEDGWQFHDYLNYQPSREQLTAQRNATRDRVTKHRERERNAVTPPVSNAVTNAPVTLPPTRPVPIPTRSEPPVGPPPAAPSQPKAPRQKPRTQAPETLEPTEKHRQLASERGLNLTREVQRCLEFHRSKGNVMADWNAAITTWLLNSERFQANPRGGPPGFEEHNTHKQAKGAAIADRLFSRMGVKP
jgi:hypothetical protein